MKCTGVLTGGAQAKKGGVPGTGAGPLQPESKFVQGQENLQAALKYTCTVSVRRRCNL